MNRNVNELRDPLLRAKAIYGLASTRVALTATRRDRSAAHQSQIAAGEDVIRLQDEELARRQGIIAELCEQLRLVRCEADQMRIKRDQLLFADPANKREVW